MKKILSFSFLGFLLMSCSSDSNEMIKETLPEIEIETPKIGLKSYGKATSVDNGIRIFETSNGFISFDNINITYSHRPAVGYTNWGLRKLNKELKVLEEKVLETTTYDWLQDIERINESTFLLGGSTATSKGMEFQKGFPLLKKVTSDGEIVNSLIIGSVHTGGASNKGEIVDIEYKDGNIYVVVNMYNDSSYLVVLDMSFNLLWKKIITESVRVSVSVDATNVYLTHSSGSFEERSVTFMKLKKEDGSVIYEKIYENTKGELIDRQFYINKTIIKGQDVFLIGSLGREKGGVSTMNGPQGVILKINKTTGEVELRLNFPDLSGISDVEKLVDGYIVIGYNINSEFKLQKINNLGTEVWAFENDDMYTYNIHLYDIGIVDESIYFTGSIGKLKADLDRDVLYGMVNVNDGKLE